MLGNQIGWVQWAGTEAWGWEVVALKFRVELEGACTVVLGEGLRFKGWGLWWCLVG
ncbi:hypothetical protein TIFTF001_020466 [Ficus carica]|uniref:Uncharacterized protein n=1 Tax=Ficus carica TaxID=3494 RepID=A0AA88AG40_FICCA|nr:hypothetical protein TIFTF001_020466 [Ficus carica]